MCTFTMRVRKNPEYLVNMKEFPNTMHCLKVKLTPIAIQWDVEWEYRNCGIEKYDLWVHGLSHHYATIWKTDGQSYRKIRKCLMLCSSILYKAENILVHKSPSKKFSIQSSNAQKVKCYM